MPLQEDITWFEQNRRFIVQQYGGQYVVVKDQTIRGAYPTYQDAYNAAAAMFGTEPFVVKLAIEEETAASR